MVGGEASHDNPVLSGVPQGSMLGPLLFLLYINDITEIQLSSGGVLNLFADDMLLYKPITSQHDYQSLQEDVNRIQEWVNTNYLSLNPSKCKCMLVTRRKSTHATSLYLGNTILEQVETFKYLGVLLSSDLNWTPHIENICSKARKLVGLLYRQFYNNASSDAMIKLYTAVIRPQLEYAAEVWDPHLQKNVELLENVQKQALRMCSRWWDLSYHTLLVLFLLPNLANRYLRTLKKLSMVYCISLLM